MKTRQKPAPAPIHHAYVARDNYGAILYCDYGNDLFKGCVSSDNRKQLLQQSLVTDLQYSLFIIIELLDGESQIVQRVIIRFSQSDKDDHLIVVNTVGEVY
jgi:hypothetical protein